MSGKATNDENGERSEQSTTLPKVKNGVVGKRGSTTPSVPNTTANHPRAINNQRDISSLYRYFRQESVIINACSADHQQILLSLIVVTISTIPIYRAHWQAHSHL